MVTLTPAFVCVYVCFGLSAFTPFSLSLLALHRASYVWMWNEGRSKGKGRVVPVLCLVVHVDEDRRVGYGSHGGAVVVRVVGGDQVWAQVRPEHS